MFSFVMTVGSVFLMCLSRELFKKVSDGLIAAPYIHLVLLLARFLPLLICLFLWTLDKGAELGVIYWCASLMLGGGVAVMLTPLRPHYVYAMIIGLVAVLLVSQLSVPGVA